MCMHHSSYLSVYKTLVQPLRSRLACHRHENTNWSWQVAEPLPVLLGCVQRCVLHQMKSNDDSVDKEFIASLSKTMCELCNRLAEVQFYLIINVLKLSLG